MTNLLRALAVILPVAALACASSTPAPEPNNETPSGEAGEADPFEIVVKDWDGPAGQEGKVLVTVKATSGYHINQDYPHKVKLEEPPDGLTLPKRELKKDDAELEGEHSLTYTIPATAAKAGQYTLKGQVRLGVCTADQCRIAKKDISANVNAQ